MSRLGTEGRFSHLELPQHDAIKLRSLPLYRLHEPLNGLHELLYGLPDKNKLPDVDKMVLLARWGRGIVGSEKTTSSTAAMPRSPEPEVAGLHAVPRCSQHTGSLD